MSQLVELTIDIALKLIEPFIKMLKWVYSLLPFEIKWRKRRPPLGIIENTYKNNTWEKTKNRNIEGISINTNWHITNTLPYNLTALNVRLRKPKKIKGSWMAKDTNSVYWGHYPIPQGYTTDVSFSFWLDDYVVKRPDKVIDAVIEIEDPIGRIHIIKGIKVKPVVATKPKVEEEMIQLENSALIKDKVEKDVIAVLKDEVEQYKVRGRREGLLGTVEWPKGQIEWRKEGETIKFLHETSSPDLVKSTNSSALVKVYNKSSEDDKKIFIKALTKRLNRETEYSDIGYLILLTFFEMGLLEKGLKVALKNLENDKRLGFSDTLRLLDFLLAFRYTEFSDIDLDLVEKTAFSTNEHTFRITQRINAIRIKRI